VNQFECHPYLTQKALREWCEKNKIVAEAYSSLGQGKLLGESVVVELASKYCKTSAQILLRWGLQSNMVIIPKSVTAERIKENCEIYDFTLNEEDMQTLNSLDQGQHFCWDPTDVA